MGSGFVDLIENVNYYFHSGIPVVYAVNGDFKTEPVVVYKSAKEEKINERSIVNLCFDDNTQSLFFSVKGIVDNKKVIGMGGLFQLKPNRNGLYLEENMIQNSAFEDTPFRLFATENGLWGITGDSSLYSKLVHIKDSFGEVISVQNEDINKIAISGCYLYKTDFLVRDNLFFYLDKEKSNIYCYDNDKIRKVTKYAQKNEDLTYESLCKVADIYIAQNENTKQIKILNLNIVYIFIISVLILVIVFLLILIGYITNKSNQLKKDKKFIFGVQETERGKISRDIHDSIIQDIRAIRIETELLNVSAESETRKNKIVNIATDCVVKLRNICYNLTPAELATHAEGDSSKIELVSIIQSLVLQFIERTRVPCQLKIDENFEYPVLDKDISQNLFRIIQEALSNVEKHSYATSCQILIKNKIEEDKKRMLIYVSDDGIGCDVKTMRSKQGKMHFGLRNIADRAELIGASVEFHSEPGQGFEVRVSV